MLDNPHRTVLLKETVDFFKTMSFDQPAWIVDATLGAGGHAEALLQQLPESVKVLGLDRDPTALEIAKRRLQPFIDQGRFRAVHSKMSEMRNHVPAPVHGVVMDLGVSSMQFDDPKRGMSFRQDAELDLRMDRTSGRPAHEMLKGLHEADIARILSEFGQERFAKRIASSLARASVRTTSELVDLVVKAIPRQARHGKIHCATRTFQALRIWINDELGELEKTLELLPQILAPGARVVVLSFHSLEDARVKRAFKALTEWNILTKKPLNAGDQELRENPRARSAKLRCAQWSPEGQEGGRESRLDYSKTSR